MMTRNISILTFLTFFLLLCLGCIGTDDDDSSSGSDDSLDDDDDDNNDNNDDDNDNNDDDDTTAIWDDLNPRGAPMNAMAGVSSHVSTTTSESWKRDFELDRLSDAGINLVRRDFKWDYIEASDDNFVYDGYDQLVDDALELGLTFNALLDYGVDWAMPDGTHDSIDPALFADFAGHCAEHFSGRIPYYEIWNEQNTIRFWTPSPNPDKYAALLLASHDAIKAADEDAVVIFGGMSTLDKYLFFETPWYFLKAAYDSHPDICDGFDVLSIHPYTFIQQTSPELFLDLGFMEYADLLGMVDIAKGILSEIGCPEKPIWFTEMGWPDLLIGSVNQGRYLVRGLMLSAMTGIEKFLWYTFWDGSGGATVPTEDAFGLYPYPEDENPIPKDSFVAYKFLLSLFGDLRFALDLSAAYGSREDDFILAFADDSSERMVIALWNAKAYEEDTVTLTLPPSETGWNGTLFTYLGNQIETYDAISEFSFGLGPSPIYLEITPAE